MSIAPLNIGTASWGLYAKLSYHVIKGCDGQFERITANMVDLYTYAFEPLYAGKITPKESFMNAYIKEVFEWENVCTYTK